MTQRINFTAGRVSSFTCPPDKSQAFMWDSDVTGLGLRVTKAGSAAYIFQARVHGISTRATIGSRDAWDIEAARTEARRLAVLVDGGTAPREEKQGKAEAHAAKQREAAQQAVTLGQLWPRYIEARRDEWGKHSLNDNTRAMQAPGLGSSTATSGRSDGNSEAPLIGQDLQDRRIAHVVTGGLSNSA